VIYNGPDTDYTGQEILFGSNETHVAIVNVTDKGNPQTISTIAYSNVEYTHQGWLTEDHRYFLLGDEADEINLGFDTRTLIFDFNDLDNPQFHFAYTGPTAATDHNGYVNGDKFFLSNNAAGLRVIDVSDLANQNMTEEGSFDSYIPDNNAGYNGAWNVYPFFESGNIVISDRTEGFLLVRPSVLGIEDQINYDDFAIYPNPASEQITINSKNNTISTISITGVLGNVLFSEIDINSEVKTIDISSYSKGIYFIKINNNTTKKIIKK
jgi:hypothetical protein